MRKLMKAGLVCLLSCSLFACSQTKKTTIGIAQIVEHDSLNTIRDTLIQELNALGYVDGDNVVLDIKNAQGEPNNLTSIMQTFAGNQVDVIVAIATPTAMAAAPYAKDIPVIFSAVSDPISANLMDDLNKPNHNITGTSDEIQVDQILDLAYSIDSSIQTIGFLYNAGEANSVSNLTKVEKYCETKGCKVETSSITNVSEISQAASVLASKVDIIFAPNDNTIANGIDALNKVAFDLSIPVYVGADSMVKDGGLASIGINYENLGKETAKMVADVLDGKNIADIPVKVFKDDLFTYINQNTADVLSINIPQTILDDEQTIIMK